MRARRIVQGQPSPPDGRSESNLHPLDGYSESEWSALRQRTIRIIGRLPATYLDPEDARIAIDCLHTNQYVAVDFFLSPSIFSMGILPGSAPSPSASGPAARACAHFSMSRCALRWGSKKREPQDPELFDRVYDAAQSLDYDLKARNRWRPKCKPD